MEPVTGRTPSPSRPPPNPAASASARGPETGDPEMKGTAYREMVTAPLPPPEEGRVENLLFRIFFFANKTVCFFLMSQNINKRTVSLVSGSQEEDSGVPCIMGSLPSSSLARQKDAIEPVPPANMGLGFFSPYFIVSKKSSGL